MREYVHCKPKEGPCLSPVQLATLIPRPLHQLLVLLLLHLELSLPLDADGEHVTTAALLCLVELELAHGEALEEAPRLLVLNDLRAVGVDANLTTRLSRLLDGKHGLVDAVLGFGRLSGLHGFGNRFCFGSGLRLRARGRAEGKEVAGHSRDLELDARLASVRISDFEPVHLVFHALVVLTDSHRCHGALEVIDGVIHGVDGVEHPGVLCPRRKYRRKVLVGDGSGYRLRDGDGSVEGEKAGQPNSYKQSVS